MDARSVVLFFFLQSVSLAQEKPIVVPRTEWSQLAPDKDRLEKKLNGKIRYISIHQTETPFPDTVDDSRRLRGIQNWHQNNPGGPGWGDIAYHYLIGPTGKIYEGRSEKYAASSGTVYLTKPQWEAAGQNEKGQTAAAKPSGVEKPGASEGHLTVSLLGTFHDELPGEVTRRNLAKFVAQKLKEHNLTIDAVFFHREIACWTDCPGQELYDWFRGFTRKRGTIGPGMTWIKAELAELEETKK